MKFFANGKKYEGEFFKDAFHGKGKYFFPSGLRYEGDFANNAFEGKG